MTSFIDDLLREQDLKRLEFDKLRADQALGAIAILEQKIKEVDDLATAEKQLIDEYRTSEIDKIQRRIDWIAAGLESLIRSTPEKTIRLARGELRLRLSKPHITIVDEKAFLDFAERKGLLRTKSSTEPDLLKVHNYVRLFGIPPGIAVSSPANRFSYKTKGSSNGEQREQGETESSEGHTSEAEAAA